jgi:hypothetical protein
MKFESFIKLFKIITYPFQYLIEEIEDMLLLKMMRQTDRNKTVSFEEVMKKLNP